MTLLQIYNLYFEDRRKMKLPFEYYQQISRLKDEKTKIEEAKENMQKPTNHIDYIDQIPKNSIELQKIHFDNMLKIEPSQLEALQQNLYRDIHPFHEPQILQQNQQNQFFEIQKKRKKQRYLRSTNNSHKKFISCLRRLFYSVISNKQKQEFQERFKKNKSSRGFFFIILAYIKHRFSQKLINSVQHSFIKEMKIKINEYQKEICQTKSLNLQNFRNQEIVDIKFSIYACQQYFLGNTQMAIECMYKKDKSTVVKRQHYEAALKDVKMIEKQLINDDRSLITSPFVEEDCQNSEKQKMLKKVIQREIRQKSTKISEAKQHDKFGSNQKASRISQNFYFDQKKHKELATVEQLIKNSCLRSIQKVQYIYPPIMQFIPYVRYDPFKPPYMLGRKSYPVYDIKQDFLGFMRHGFGNIYQHNGC